VPAAAAIETLDLVKRFPDGTRALDGVSLSIPRGQTVVLLGPSGAGKTTLLRCLNRLTEPTSGQIRVLGTDLTALRGAALRAVRRRIAMVFQQFHLIPTLSALDNVLVGRVGRISDLRVLLRRFAPEDRTRALALLDEVGLAGKALVRASDLSGGQQQRVALARALAQDPDVLLCDEPAASLDPRLARQVLESLRAAARERSLTLVINLHSVEQARAIAERVVALRAGRVVLDVAPDRLEEQAVAQLYAEDDAVEGAHE
jgi:phosphonate transport system ATP-binding protein